jgi:exodeoxyribonuclease VII small subunit
MAADPEQPLSYEAAREELLDVVRQLEAGGLPLEKSLALWERGEELAQICQNWLDGARARLSARRPGEASDEPEDDETEDDD